MMRTRIRNSFGFAILLAVVPASASTVHDSVHHESELALILAEASKPSVQTGVIRTTGGIDTTGWVLIAMVHGTDATLVREGQLVRAFSVNARTRLHQARITRVTRQQHGVRVEATLATRVLGTSTRYLMEIVTESI